jgi:hypothetical protein
LDRGGGVSGKSWGIEDDKKRYLQWLEEMWDVHKFDPHGSTEREEKRKEEILEMFKSLAHVSKSRVEPPSFLDDPPSS